MQQFIKMKRFILLLFPTVFLFSCIQNNPSGTQTADSADTVKSNENKISQEMELEGLYADHHLINCADNERIVLSGDIKKIDSVYKSLLPDAYSGQTIYVKLKGLLTSEEGKNKELSVREVLRAEQKNDRNTCIPYDYWCRGTEPFWVAEISEEENLIDFFDPMASKYTHFTFSKPEMKSNATIYTAEDKSANSKIRISITKEKCSDGMSEREYQYKSEVVLNGTIYKGCAVNAFQSK